MLLFSWVGQKLHSGVSANLVTLNIFAKAGVNFGTGLLVVRATGRKYDLEEMGPNL